MITRIAMWRRANGNLVAIAWAVMALAAAATASAQVPVRCNTPVSERTSEVGCYTTATKILGAMPQGPVFWHLYNYPTRAAAGAVKGPHGTVVEAFGKVWVYAVEEEGWHPSGGERVAAIGPLPVASGKKYTARYFEVVFTPGMEGTPHRHSGPEAWYVLTGAQCLETPEGIMVKHAGESGIVPEGPPMNIKAIGTEIRRAVFIVLHDTSQPWITIASDWKPKGRTCRFLRQSPRMLRRSASLRQDCCAVTQFRQLIEGTNTPSRTDGTNLNRGGKSGVKAGT